MPGVTREQLAARELDIWPVGPLWQVRARVDEHAARVPVGPLHDTYDKARAYALELNRAGRGRLPNPRRRSECTSQ